MDEAHLYLGVCRGTIRRKRAGGGGNRTQGGAWSVLAERIVGPRGYKHQAGRLGHSKGDSTASAQPGYPEKVITVRGPRRPQLGCCLQLAM